MAKGSGSRWSATRAMTRVAWRDPENISERLTLYAAQRLAGSARDWAEGVREARADTPLATIAEEVRSQSAGVARIDGAVSGTPFFIALVPGYLAYLWQEARMGLRIAALYGRDPATMRTAGEMWRCGGCTHAGGSRAGARRRRATRRRPRRCRSADRCASGSAAVYRLLVFGGFMAPPKDKSAEAGQEDEPEARAACAGRRHRGRDGDLAEHLGVPDHLHDRDGLGCESHCRQLGRRITRPSTAARAHAGGGDRGGRPARGRGHESGSPALRSLLFLSVAIPVGFVAYATMSATTGVNLIGAWGRSSRSRWSSRPSSWPPVGEA